MFDGAVKAFFDSFFSTALIFLKNPLYDAIIILGILCTIFYKKWMGKIGEAWVKSELNKLDKNKYKRIDDVTVRTSDGNSHQIDHLVVSPYGIFVIETKQYSGYIKGNEYDVKWFQNKKIQINNPIRQNYGHVKSLEEVLQLDESKFIPIVCISGGAKVNVKTTKNAIARLNNLNSIIKSYTQEELFNYEDIYLKVLSLNITDKEQKKQHVKDVKEIKKEKDANSINKCPRCGGNLVERVSSKDGNRFLGCSNYPRCKYTRNI